MEKALTESLFSYGTLQNESVQLCTFGRTLEGYPDTLVGYKLEMIEIRDKDVIVSSGTAYHPIIKHTSDYSDTIKGTVFNITKEELKQADDYEVDDYKRILVQLQSGNNAWVYVSVF